MLLKDLVLVSSSHFRISSSFHLRLEEVRSISHQGLISSYVVFQDLHTSGRQADPHPSFLTSPTPCPLQLPSVLANPSYRVPLPSTATIFYLQSTRSVSTLSTILSTSPQNPEIKTPTSSMPRS